MGCLTELWGPFDELGDHLGDHYGWGKNSTKCHLRQWDAIRVNIYGNSMYSTVNLKYWSPPKGIFILYAKTVE